ncbi:MAG: formyltransferase family protein [Xanthobacteraceae bacterium]
MFDTIILLTGLVEQPPLASLLREHNPLLKVVPISSAAELAEVGPEVLERARLIAFTTTVIVPGSVLDRLGYGAYNFHPGPPEYPGWAPAHFALYHGATEFGATVHAMVERVDEGLIIQVDRFPIPPMATAAGLEEMAYGRLARMFWNLAKQLATQAAPLGALPISWSTRKHTRRHYAAMCDIPLDISREELERRLEIFGHNHFGMMPTIRLHGVEFRAVRSEPQLPTSAPSLVPDDRSLEALASG